MVILVNAFISHIYFAKSSESKNKNPCILCMCVYVWRFCLSPQNGKKIFINN